MLKNNTIAAYSIGSSIITKILNFLDSKPKTKILEQIEIYGSSNRDGSAVVTLEWMGSVDGKFILGIFNEIKKLVVDFKKEVKEQSEPSLVKFKNLERVTYTFRIWNVDGKYEYLAKEIEQR